MKTQKIITTILFSVALVLTVNGQALAKQNPEPQQDQLPIEDVQRFSIAISQIKNYYVEDVPDTDLFENAIRGMLTGLDPHSDYLNIDEFADLKSHTTGEFGGLGIEVGMEDGYIRVVSPIDGTPADKAGIKPGDIIVKLDDKPVKGMTLRDAVNIMRGPKGTPIDLTIIRKNEKRLLQVTVVRDIIRVESVRAEILDPGYGYVRVSHFQSPTGLNLIDSVTDLQNKAQAQGGLKGLVLDLRNNPGGLLDSAIDVSDAFLDSNDLKDNTLIVYTEGRIPSAEMKVSAKPGDILENVPMVVLINEGSASGSEIVAGALQDHKRAVIMGKTSFGKGSVQTVLPLDEKRGLKITTALYFTPKGRSIQATGIVPDIEVSDLEVAANDSDNLALAILKEADFDNHLANGNGHEDKPKANDKQQSSATDDEDNDASQPLAVRDYQLHEALNLLKALNVVSNQ